MTDNILMIWDILKKHTKVLNRYGVEIDSNASESEVLSRWSTLKNYIYLIRPYLSDKEWARVKELM